MIEHPTILAIETATSVCSVGLLRNGNTFSSSEIGNNIHSQVLLTMVQSLLDEHGVNVQQIDAVAVGQGPGSFTGLRIGVGVAQGIAYGASCDMLGVSSLDILAHQAPEDGAVVVGIDARMNEIYWCEYIKKGNKIARVSDLAVSAPSDIKSKNADCQFVGNAWSVYQNNLATELNITLPTNDCLYPNAESLLVLAQQSLQNGETISPVDFAPEYVRNNVAKKSTKKTFV